MVRRLGWSVALGVALFLLHHAGVVSGALAPPPGFEPAWTLRNLDVPQYLTWIEAARSQLLLPDYHAPWVTEPALFQPLLLAAARTGLPTLLAYYAPVLAGYVFAVFALLYASSVFCPGRETLFALLAAFCTVPFRLIGWLIAQVVPLPKVLVVLGLLDYSYDTADGLFRGGMSNSVTLSVGTALVLLSMAALARYVETGRRSHLLRLAALTFLSAFLHPFEVFVIVAAAAVPLVLCRRIRVWMGIALCGLAGLSPYLALSFGHRWLRDVSELTRYPLQPFWILANFGIPLVLLVYLLLLRFRLPRSSDRVLQSWFIATIVVPFLPGAPFAPHLFDGFAYCVGFLLVRRLAADTTLLTAMGRHRRAAWPALGAVTAISVASLALLYVQIWRDGRRADPEWLLSSVRPVSERPLIEWFRRNAPTGALVLSPLDVSPWIATVPLTSFASHDVFGITYQRQHDLAERFFRGEDLRKDLLDQYGVRFVVAPATLRMSAGAHRADVGPWRIYEFPEARMKPYPGLDVLDPARAPSLRKEVLDWFASHH
jgi:hypothetical protein